LRLNKSLVLKGIEYRTEVYLPAYDATIEVRPLSDIEFAECREEARIFNILKTLGISVKDLESKNQIDVQKILNSDETSFDLLDAQMNTLYRAAAKRGIVDPELRALVDNPRKGEPGEPDSVMVLELLTGGSMALIGAKILEITSSPPKDIANFSNQPTESNSQSSTPPVISSEESKI